MKSRIGLIDYGAGNFASVRNALLHLSLNLIEVRNREDLERASHLILPGVGAFPTAMENLVRSGLLEELRKQILNSRKPILGICVGMQLFAEVGNEFRRTLGLGFIKGSVDKLGTTNENLPLPHMGWNEITLLRPCPLFKGMSEKPSFYFVHSYQVHPMQANVVVATADYGSPLTACIQQENIFGVQFHPEKSQHDGLLLLKHFSQYRSC